APEQARGEGSSLDERCDVFGLGAILCQILTGAPPYTGGGPSAVFARAVRADLADALGRLDACGADAELIGLAQRSLAADAEGRPRDAGAVAAEVTAYLESVEARVRRADLERAQSEVRAEGERRRRRLVVALAASVLLAAGAAAGGWVWVAQERAGR